MKNNAIKFMTGLVSGATLLLTCIAATSLAHADALHGFCAGTTEACSDNGTNTVTNDTTPDFGFWAASGPSSGDLYLEFLVANNEAVDPFSVSFLTGGTGTVAASLFSTTAWTSGQLADYLGFGSSNTNPSNPIGAYLPTTQAIDSGATGFYVYQAYMGNLTLGGSASTSPTFSLSGALPWGSFIVGFLDPPPSVTATANSGAILVSPVPEPQTYAMLLAGLCLIGFVARRNRNINLRNCELCG